MRYNSLVYLRFLAIFFVVCCHFLPFYFGEHVCNLFGAVGNSLFFLLSALLIGKKWSEQDNSTLGGGFLLHRIYKILPSYYLFLLFMFIAVYVCDHTFSVTALAKHLLFLPWFGKINGFGHLWFITMIVFCYLLVALFSIVNKAMNDALLKRRIVLLPLTIVAVLIIQFLGAKRDLPTYPIAILGGFVLIFLFSDVFFVFKKRKCLFVAIFLTLVGISYFEFSTFLVEFKFLVFDFGMIFAFLLILLFLSYEEKMHSVNPEIQFIAMISFEIYLVHHFLCVGKYSIYRMFPNPFICTAVFLLITVICAFLLHTASNYIIKKACFIRGNKIKQS